MKTIIRSNGLRIVSIGEDLDALLQQVTPENLHGETETASAVGKEIW